MKTTSTKKITLSAILAAVGVIIILISGVFTTLDLTCAVLAGFCVIIAVIEVGGFYPYLVYLVCALSSVLLCPNKIAPMLFLLFTGWYPILKRVIEAYHPVIVWALKLSAFNIFFGAVVLASTKLALLTEFALEMKPLVFLVANGAFVLYDVALTSVITFYLMKIRKMLGLKNFFEN